MCPTGRSERVLRNRRPEARTAHPMKRERTTLPQRLAVVALLWNLPAVGQTVERYDGMCDASAAVALDARRFVVAGDEKNELHIYERGRPQVLAKVPLDDYLRTGGDQVDLEAGARIGDRIYWMGSMGRNRKGRLAPARDRFFATDIEHGSDLPTLRPAGGAPARLRDAIIASDAGREWQLGQAAAKAPEAAGGMNIEGLAHTGDGTLLIGFRNPLRAGKALVLPLLNPADVVAGQAPRFGAAVALDLGGRGVRAMSRTSDGYLVVGGPVVGGPVVGVDANSFALFHWRGGSDTPQALALPALGTLRPEAVFGWPDGMQWQLLSDDGAVMVDGKPCKKLELREQGFRSLTFTR